MAQSVAVVRNTLSAISGGDVDFTKASFGTPSAAVVIGCSAHAAGNPAATLGLSIGFWDGTSQAGISIRASDASSSAGTGTWQSNGEGFNFCNGTFPPSGVLAGYTISNITDGISLELTTDATSNQRFATALLLSGISAKLIRLYISPTQNQTVVSEALGFTPKAVIAMSANSISPGHQDAQIACGFALESGLHRMKAFSSLHSATSELANVLFSEDRCCAAVLNDAQQWSVEVSAWNSDTISVTTRDASPGGSPDGPACYFLVLGGDVSLSGGTLTTRTSVGDTTTEASVNIEALFACLSTATGTTLETGDGANGIGFGMADAIGQFSHNVSVEDGNTTTNTNNAAQDAEFIDIDSSVALSRTDLVDATVSFSGSNFTSTYSVVDAVARKGWYLAFGPASVSGVPNLVMAPYIPA